MVLVRIAYAADLPSPEDVIRSLNDSPQPPVATAARQLPNPPPPAGAGRLAAAVLEPAPCAPRSVLSPFPPAAESRLARQALAPSVTPPVRDAASRSAEMPATVQSPRFARFSDLIAFAGARRDLQLKTILERDVRLVRFEDGKLEVALEPGASHALIGDLGQRLATLTGRRWMIAVSAEAGEPTVRSQLAARREEFKRGVQADPLVQSVLARFPGTEIVAVRGAEPEAPLPVIAVEDEELSGEMPVDDGESISGGHDRSDDVDDDV